MDKDEVIFLLIIISALYIYIICIKDIISNINNKFKVKRCRKSIISLKIDGKSHFPGISYSSGVNNLGANPKLPDSYIINCSDENDVNYFINDKEVFESYDIGDAIKLELIEKLDKNNEV
ncbi:MAG: hypothetical protein ACRCXA_05410, partial [Peptostreptococcaceae bacterium]